MAPSSISISLQDRAQHDRALPEPGRLERAPFEQRGVAGDDAREHVGMERELRERPPERGEQVGHRGDVQEHDVAGDALRAFGLVDVGPAARDLVEEAARAAGLGEQLTDGSFEPRERGPLGLLVGRRRRPCMRAGCTNASAPSSWSSSATSRSNQGGSAAWSPIQHASPSRWPTRRANPNASSVPAAPSSASSRSSAWSRWPRYVSTSWAPNRSCAMRAHAGEQLLGQLAHEHAVVGDALARVALGQRVERAQRRRARTRTGCGRVRTPRRRCRRARPARPASAPTGFSAVGVVPRQRETRTRRRGRDRHDAGREVLDLDREREEVAQPVRDEAVAGLGERLDVDGADRSRAPTPRSGAPLRRTRRPHRSARSRCKPARRTVRAR